MTPARALCAAAALLSVGASAACADPGSTTCACESPNVTIVVPTDRAAALASVLLSGPACSGSSAQCVDAVDGGCAELAFRATAEGPCTVDVEFNEGPPSFQASIEFLRSACCPGFYPQVPADSTIEVPDLGADAGAGG